MIPLARSVSYWGAGAVLAGLLAIGCVQVPQSEFEMILELAEMNRTPDVLQVAAPEPSGPEVILGDARLLLPPGWTVARVRRFDPDTPESQYVEGWAAVMAAPSGSQTTEVPLSYLRLPSYVEVKPRKVGELGPVSSFIPSGFFDPYATDLELFEAFHNVVPRDYRDARGKRREHVKALLYLKCYSSLPWRYEGPGFVSFFGEPTTLASPPVSLHAHLFDKAGRCRGHMLLLFPEGIGRDRAEEMGARMLYHLEFVGPPAGPQM